MTATDEINATNNNTTNDAPGNEIKNGQTYTIRRQDGTLHEAVIIQARITDDDKTKEYYVHYSGLNRRLDQWITFDQILSPNAIEGSEIAATTETTIKGNQSPTPPTTGAVAISGANATLQRSASVLKTLNMSTVLNDSLTISDNSDRKITRNQKRRHDEINHVQKPYSEMDPTTAALEKEHEAITKVKYIDALRIGKFEIDTWYFSPYPDEYGKVKTLYVCQYCLKYMKYEATYRRHCVSQTGLFNRKYTFITSHSNYYRKSAAFVRHRETKSTARG